MWARSSYQLSGRRPLSRRRPWLAAEAGRRTEGGEATTHPLLGDELRALRDLAINRFRAGFDFDDLIFDLPTACHVLT